MKATIAWKMSVKNLELQTVQIFFFFVHTRQDTNVGNHSHVHSTNNHIYNKDGTTVNDGFDIKL